MRRSTSLLSLALAAGLTLASLAATSANAATMSPSNWRLNLSVTAGGTPDNSTQLGTDPGAVSGYDDSYDFPNPPLPFQEYVDAYFTHVSSESGWGGFGGNYATDVRPPLQSGETLEWDELVIASTYGTTEKPAQIKVTWPGIKDVPARVALKLKDPNDLNGDGVREYDLRTVSSFEFPSVANGVVQHYALGVSASLVETQVVAGDLNGDGRVTTQDATLALRAAIGLQVLTPDQQEAADVTGEGRVNVQDATLILRVAVGLTTL